MSENTRVGSGRMLLLDCLASIFRTFHTWGYIREQNTNPELSTRPGLHLRTVCKSGVGVIWGVATNVLYPCIQTFENRLGPVFTHVCKSGNSLEVYERLLGRHE